MLFIFGGLPGTGKSELSIHLARKIGAIHLRIDTIEQALRMEGMTEIGPKGYVVAYNIAADNLRLGLSVVADSVNPLTLTRNAWRDVALHIDVAFQEIEVICSDQDEHRNRIESRQSSIPGLKLPTWQDVVTRDYESWQGDRLVIDTAGQTPDESKKMLDDQLGL